MNVNMQEMGIICKQIFFTYREIFRLDILKEMLYNSNRCPSGQLSDR